VEALKARKFMMATKLGFASLALSALKALLILPRAMPWAITSRAVGAEKISQS
jgi:hypothetical protein